MDIVRLGIIGSGFMAHTYAEVTTKYNHHARLVAIAGGRRAPDLAARYSVDAESSVEGLVARPDLDAVIITSPEQVRLEQTRLAAQAGKHVLAEKPMAPTVAECDGMIQACDAADVTLMVIQSQRFRGVHARAQALIQAGRIGEVRHARVWSLLPEAWSVPVVGDRPWYNDPDAGLFMSQAVHNFDMLRWLVGSDAQRIYAQVTSVGQHGIPNLSANALVDFESGATGQVWINMEMPGMAFPVSQFHSQVVDSRGLLDMDGYAHLDLGVDGAWQRVWEQPPFDPFNPLDPVRLESFAAQNQAFIDALRSGQTPAVTGADGRAAVELCQAALLSARTRQPVDLPLR